MEDFNSRLAALRGKQIAGLQEKRDEQVAERQEAARKQQLQREKGSEEWRKCADLEDVLRLMDIDKYVLKGSDRTVTMHTGWIAQDICAALFISLPVSYGGAHLRVLWSEEKFKFAGDWVDYLSKAYWGKSVVPKWRHEGADAVEVAEILIETLAPLIDAEKCVLR